jgi:hypothetical protein
LIHQKKKKKLKKKGKKVKECGRKMTEKYVDNFDARE